MQRWFKNLKTKLTSMDTVYWPVWILFSHLWHYSDQNTQQKQLGRKVYLGFTISEISVHGLPTLLLWTQSEAAHHGGRDQWRKAAQLKPGSGNREDGDIHHHCREYTPFPGQVPMTHLLQPDPICLQLPVGWYKLQWTE